MLARFPTDLEFSFFEDYRMRIWFILIWTCLLTGHGVSGICEEIQEKVIAFGKGKDLKELFSDANFLEELERTLLGKTDF